MALRKPQSKRFSTRHRAKVDKKLREHRRKVNKEAKVKKTHKSKKDPGIPGDFPGKEEFKQKMLAEKEKEKQQRQLAKMDLAAFAAKAEASQAAHAEETHTKAQVGGRFHDSSKRAFYKDFKSVVENADVILEVLDARDPEGSRVKAVEELVASCGSRKRIVLVLNKIDLVPKEVVAKWLMYLRRELPTVAFRSSTSEAAVGADLGVGTCLGADALVQLLKNYCRSHNLKTSVRVGVVGYPNVGKSSLINSLKRAKVCKVGATPGVTTSAQEIHLDKNITLLDSPGIVFASPTDAGEMAHLFLRNCVRVEQLEDPILPVELILKKTAAETLMCLYTIPRFNTVQEFLSLVAQRMGRLKKGGIANIESAAKSVLNDWNQGKIPFHTSAPEIVVAPGEAGESVIVGGWAPEFDINAIIGGGMDVELMRRDDAHEAGLNEMAVDQGAEEYDFATDYKKTQ